MRPSLLMNSTKRALALVAGASAVLAANTLGATSAKAQLTNLLQNGIQRPTSGILIGGQTMAKGTITYRNSAGSNDAFSVGTNTSINANASASSTSDYQVTSTASFDMGNNAPTGVGGGLSTINQMIGRSSSESVEKSLTTDQSKSLSTSANTTAESEVTKQFKTESDSNATGGRRYYRWRNNRWNEMTGSSASTDYESAKTAEYNKQYDSAFSKQLSQLASNSSADGTISGKFEKNAGASNTSNFESVQYRNNATGSVIDTTKYAVTKDTLDNTKATATSNTTGETVQLTVEVTQVSDFSQTAATTNNVTVQGINSSNSIIADDGAEFTSTISKIDTTTAGGDSGTASGSAAGAVSTTASASAQSSSFISSFVQAY